jgi:hypothetical protein
MNLGADIGPLAACHALGHGSLGRVGPSQMPVVVVVTTESQRDQPVGPARGTLSASTALRRSPGSPGRGLSIIPFDCDVAATPNSRRTGALRYAPIPLFSFEKTLFTVL